jgi:mannose-1-phosphate guanylyltransferase
MSTPDQPKQLLRFINGQSLLSTSAGRLMGLVAPENIFVCTSNAYAEKVLDDLPFLSPDRLLGEPMGRDTLNAVGFSAAVIHKIDPQATLAILTADHLITPVPEFQRTVMRAFELAESMPDYLFTFGITPTFAATGFGYLECGEAIAESARRVAAFREKPDAETAEAYFRSGRHLWNSGMFVWKTATILEQIRVHQPAAYAGLQEIAAAYGTTGFSTKVTEIYPNLPKISIDYAIMEKAPKVATIPMNVQWIDVGSWSSYAQTLSPDKLGNRASNADILAVDASGIVAVSDSRHLVAVVGLNDLVVVNSGHVTMICPADQCEKVKSLAQAAQKAYPDGYHS